MVRQCSYDGTNDDRVRSVLFHNQGDGRFEALPTEVSGVSGCAIGAFAVDIDADGWLDLHLAVRESLQTDGPLTDLVLRNRGAELAQGTRHWIAVRLSGRPEAELLGARVSAFGNDDLRVSNGWYEREAWRGSTDPTVHLGLSDQTEIRLEVRLRDGSVHHFEPDSVDATVTLDL